MEKKKGILEKQSSMKVVLNGGKYELDDATIPFQIGFDESVAEKKPAYVLVVDITENIFNETGERIICFDGISERTLFKLEPIQYLQLKKPGIHHLIFIIFSKLWEFEKEFLLEKTNRANYENRICWGLIDRLFLLGRETISYYEEIINVPEEFFAIKPKAGIKKVIWKWVNLWYSFDPIDQWEYIKRAIFAFTTQPILWLIGFLVRLTLAIIWTTFFFILKTFALIFGYQPVKFIPYKKKVWYEFLICYPREKFNVLNPTDWTWGDFGGHSEEGYYPYKTLGIGKKRIHVPLTLAGVITYITVFSVYISLILIYFDSDISVIISILGFIITVMLSFFISSLAVSKTLPTFKKSERWKKRWNYNGGQKLRQKVGLWMFSILTGVSLLLCMITQIPWAKVFIWGLNAVIFLTILLLVSSCFYFLLKFLLKKIKKIRKNIKQTRITPKKSEFDVLEEKHKEWLLASFNINNLPQKVDLKLMPKSSSPVHKFVIGLWQAKAKVCKPYAK